MHRERKIQISDLMGKQYIVIGSVKKDIDFVSRSARVRVSFSDRMGEFHSDAMVPGCGNTCLATVKVPEGAGSATVFLETDQQDYDLGKLIAFVSDAAAAA